jgi:hypothetical protein
MELPKPSVESEMVQATEPADVEACKGEATGLGGNGASQAPSASARNSHTPGPWTLTLTDKGNACIGAQVTRWPAPGQRRHASRALTVRDIKIEGVIVTRIEGATVPLAEGLANAQLIAAAPDLLAALRALVTQWEETFDVEMEDLDASNALDRARAAIAKAEERE